MMNDIATNSGREVALVDLLDRLLGGGVVVVGDLVLAIADVDLVRVSVRALLLSIAGEVDDGPPPRAVRTHRGRPQPRPRPARPSPSALTGAGQRRRVVRVITLLAESSPNERRAVRPSSSARHRRPR